MRDLRGDDRMLLRRSASTLSRITNAIRIIRIMEPKSMAYKDVLVT